jgi:hypothetical protein
MIYQLQLQARYLGQLCVTWQSKIRLTPGGHTISDDSWGPTAADLSAVQTFEFYESTTQEAESDDEWENEQEDDGGDAELWEAIEQSALVNEFRGDFELGE